MQERHPCTRIHSDYQRRLHDPEQAARDLADHFPTERCNRERYFRRIRRRGDKRRPSARRHFGADVTSVCSAANLELVESLGARWVMGYNPAGF